MSELWDFVSDPSNQATLTWLGGGLIALAGGVWAVVRFLAGRGGNSAATLPGQTPVQAGGGSLAAGQGVSIRTNRGLSGLQVVLLLGVLIGGVLLAGGLLGKRITATNCGIAAVGKISGGTITAECPAPADR